MKTEMDTEKDLFEIEEETAEEPKADQGEKKTESKSKTEDASKEENEPVKYSAYHTEKEAEKERIQSFKESCLRSRRGEETEEDSKW